MSSNKRYFQFTVQAIIYTVWHHFEPIAADVYIALFAVVFVCLGLQIYFMPVKSKLEGIAKAKARHGIPLDQPHHIDQILKEGFFRIS